MPRQADIDLDKASQDRLDSLLHQLLSHAKPNSGL